MSHVPGDDFATVKAIMDEILKIYLSLLLLVGLPGNFMCGWIMGSNKTSRITTRLLMVVLSVSDSAVLVTAISRYWLKKVFKWDIRNLGPITCKTHLMTVGFVTDYAVGALCALAVERLLVVAFPHRATVIVTMSTVTIGLTVMGATIIVKNSMHIWIMGYYVSQNAHDQNQTTTSLNETKITTFECRRNEDMALSDVFLKFDFFTYSVLPYIILFTSNMYIFLRLRRQRKLLKRASSGASKCTVTVTGPLMSQTDQALSTSSRPHEKISVTRRKRRHENVIKILMALSLIHVGSTLPATIWTLISEYFKNVIEENAQNLLIKEVLVYFLFMNNATNFIGYYISCTSFREGFRRTILGWFSCFHSSNVIHKENNFSLTKSKSKLEVRSRIQIVTNQATD